MGEIVENLITSSRLPALLNSVRSGHTLNFGVFQVQKRGLFDERSQPPRTLLWDAPVTVAVSPYKVSIKASNQKKAWASVERKPVPNAALLAALAATLAADSVEAKGKTGTVGQQGEGP